MIAFTLLASMTAGVNGGVPSTPVRGEQALREAEQITAMNPHWEVVRGQGHSMTPYFGEHSLLLVDRSTGGALRPGTVMLYRDRDGDLIAHKVVGTDDNLLIAQGLNNTNVDPAPVPRDAVEGVVFGVLHTSGIGEYARDLPVVTGKTWK